ncbi:16S rRNA (cytidine(1402)-2'-O)-methyltransferase [Flavipsychrobacter stenotrophus]|uniref:Ribosomal RNA small subunit methyltransferase I n=1 Tax=Flavipsychrobacter stenotrophus TaxID=2077091 RepID=A0A2S7SR07_9BACT|nr:16S rRNA (cytidine(1402)-2'-O)-methyltransferase [Flavipsychrobacter stenotrophus]PQJ09339.1 16S rRNA (cytidine(1402)-2'-O)-methyltransferase [Flavipsychrobacter stenotrophus]
MPLYLIPSPIGNLGDITYRAVEVMKEVDCILCEDTRTSGVLVRHYNIQKPLTAYHQHNEHKVVPHLVDQMKAGKSFALITDAGTPGISDPGFLLVRECIANGVHVECLPGATAFVPALVQSGIPSNRFVFEGFLPPKKGRQTMLKKLAEEERTIILYESPHRLVKTLQEFVTYFGADRRGAVCRELTKMFEETNKATMAELAAHYEAHPPKGEIVMVIEGKVVKEETGKSKNKYKNREEDETEEEEVEDENDD